MKTRNIIKVCQGPGCKAWGAEVLYDRLKAQSEATMDKAKICFSKCRNRCGGGATVEYVARQAFVKIKTSSEQTPTLLCI